MMFIKLYKLKKRQGGKNEPKSVMTGLKANLKAYEKNKCLLS